VDDRIEQVRYVTRHLDYVTAAGEPERTEKLAFAIRYVFKPEMELLLRAAGFARWEVRPLAANPAGGALAIAERGPEEGDTLLWSAWAEA
jgi:hypothetical protein